MRLSPAQESMVSKKTILQMQTPIQISTRIFQMRYTKEDRGCGRIIHDEPIVIEKSNDYVLFFAMLIFILTIACMLFRSCVSTVKMTDGDYILMNDSKDIASSS